MANKPVFGVAICPKCHKRNPIFWNGNFVWQCVHCYTVFKVKRQKLLDVESLQARPTEGTLSHYDPKREEK